jgi:hypothetical protein
LAAVDEAAVEPFPKSLRNTKSVVELFGLTKNPSVAFADLSLLSEPTITKSVKVCGIEVNSIEAAAVPRVLVSISFIRRLLRKG